MTKRVFARGLAITLAVAALSAVLYANHAWANYHWARISNPFTLKLGNNVSSGWDAYLAEASSDWNTSIVLDTTLVPGGTRPKTCRPTAGRVEVCNAAYGGTGWLGVAQIWVSGSHITQGTAKMNDTYFNTAQYNTPPWRRLVMCQEVAHTFGLGHQDENFSNPNLGSCMDYTSDPDGPPSNEHPNAHDFDQLETIYAHLDSSSTVGRHEAASGMPPAMGQMDLEGPGQWGRLVKGSKDSGVQIYEQDFGRGHKVVTFVIWTLEARGNRTAE